MTSAAIGAAVMIVHGQMIAAQIRLVRNLGVFIDSADLVHMRTHVRGSSGLALFRHAFLSSAGSTSLLATTIQTLVIVGLVLNRLDYANTNKAQQYTGWFADVSLSSSSVGSQRVGPSDLWAWSACTNFVALAEDSGTCQVQTSSNWYIGFFLEQRQSTMNTLPGVRCLIFLHGRRSLRSASTDRLVILPIPISRLLILDRLPSLVRQSGTVYQLTSPGLAAYGLQTSSKKLFISVIVSWLKLVGQ